MTWGIEQGFHAETDSGNGQRGQPMFGKRLWPLHGPATKRRTGYGHNDLRRQHPGLCAKGGPGGDLSLWPFPWGGAE